jgi:hypothetical protein
LISAEAFMAAAWTPAEPTARAAARAVGRKRFDKKNVRFIVSLLQWEVVVCKSMR